MEQVRTLAERAQIPVALTLLGLGGFPASHPLNLGMMGMHGEAWVNHAIQEADLLIACGMRFDDRVTGTLATYAHEGQEDSHRSRSGGDQQEREGRRGAGGRSARGARSNCCRALPGRDGSAWLKTIEASKGAVCGARHQEPARLRPPVRGARDARPVAHDRRQRHRRDRRGPAPDVGGAVFPPRDSRAR